jgi:hypothetical protein
MSNPDRSRVARPEAQVVAQLRKILAEVRAVAAQPDFSLADAEQIGRLVRHAARLVRQAQRDADFDSGLYDVPRRDRRALRRLDNQWRARP